MRMVLAVLSIATLAGCGFSEEAAQNAFRESSIRSCITAAQGQGNPATAGVDWQRMCTCVTDKIMADKSAQELLQIRPGDPEQRAAAEQCLAELGVGGPGAGGGKPTG